VSVGRGTDRPFEIVGAPWIEPRRFATSLQTARISGVQFVPIFFTPNAGKNQGVRCGGVSLLITNTEKLNSVLLGLTLISVLHKLYPGEFEMDNVMELLGNAEVMKKLKAGQSLAAMIWESSPDFEKFLVQRRKALIYDPAPKRKEGGNNGSGRS